MPETAKEEVTEDSNVPETAKEEDIEDSNVLETAKEEGAEDSSVLEITKGDVNRAIIVQGKVITDMTSEQLDTLLEMLNTATINVVEYSSTVSTHFGCVFFYLNGTQDAATDLHLSIFAEETEDLVLLRYVGTDGTKEYNEHLEISDANLYEYIVQLLEIIHA